MAKPSLGFGIHLTLDGYGCSYERLTNLDAIHEFLDRCPDLIQMTKIMPPYVFKYHGKVPEDWGLSGFVLIAESHISVHTYPERGYVSLDIFSIKDFDYQEAVEYVSLMFGIVRREVNLLERGKEFPREVRAIERLLREERKKMQGGPPEKSPDEAAWVSPRKRARDIYALALLNYQKRKNYSTLTNSIFSPPSTNFA